MRLINSESQPIIVALTNAGVPQTGLTVSIAIWKISDQSNVSPSPPTLTELGGGIYFLPANKLPDISDDAIVYKIDGSATLADADRYKFGALVFGGYPDVIYNSAGVGNGAYEVNHHYDGQNALTIYDENNSPIENANIYIFSKTDWDNNNRTKAYQKGWSLTDGNGQWLWSVWLDEGTYKLIIDSPGVEVKYPTEFIVSSTKSIWTG